MIDLTFGSMTCVDLGCRFMLKKVICFYNIKPVTSSFNEGAERFARVANI
jgi:hypothetical protein